MSIRQMMYILKWVTILGCVQTQSDWHFSGVNVALNKSTGQLPGTFTHLGTKYGSQLAVNGKTHDDDLCSHTTRAKNATAFWMVYLADQYIIKGIRIYNRELLRKRLDNFQIIGFPNETILYDDSIAQPPLSRTLVIDVPVFSTIPFSNITIRVPAHTGPPDDGHSILTLCEVEIYTVLNYCSFNKLNIDDNLQWNLRFGTGYINNTHKLVAPESVIDFTCRSCYNLIGSNNTICLLNGSYGDNIPKCVEMEKQTSPEHSSLDPVATGGIAAGACVVGVGVGLIVALLIWKWRSGTTSPITGQPSDRNSTYFTPTEAGLGDLHSYEDISVQSNI